MKGTGSLAIAIIVAMAAGCGADAPAPAQQAADDAPPPQFAFVAKSEIPVRLTLLATAEGGRVGPLYGGYRPSLAFDAAPDADAVTCSIASAAAGGFDPGETHEATLRCARPVSVRPDALGFTVREGGQVVGSGMVLP
jgi:translation elongation factor EF-Tu-like GTPase